MKYLLILVASLALFAPSCQLAYEPAAVRAAQDYQHEVATADAYMREQVASIRASQSAGTLTKAEAEVQIAAAEAVWTSAKANAWSRYAEYWKGVGREIVDPVAVARDVPGAVATGLETWFQTGGNLMASVMAGAMAYFASTRKANTNLAANNVQRDRSREDQGLDPAELG